MIRIEPHDSIAMVVDIQERLLPHIDENQKVLQNTLKLINGLKLLNIPFIVNEQYPKGIGHTVEPIKELLQDESVFEKVTFSCCKTDETMNEVIKQNKKFIIVFGIETHVCVLQSVIDLLSAGYSCNSY